MNQEQRRTYSQLNIGQMNRLERRFVKSVYSSLRPVFVRFAHLVRERGVEGTKRVLERLMMQEDIGEAIQEIYVVGGLFYAQKAYREVIRSARARQKDFSMDEDWVKEILEYLKAHLLEGAVWRVTETTRELIQAVMDKGVAEGWTTEYIASQIQSEELSAWRAKLITRTELAKAAFTGRKFGEEKVEYETEKEWISANDHRVRDSHRTVDGEVVDSDARFQVPRRSGGVDMMDGPGDPTASVENIANCRCTTATVAKRDEQGRLIPKTKIAIILPGAFNTPRQTITI